MMDVTIAPLVFTCKVTCTCGGARVNWMVPSGIPNPPIPGQDFTGRMATLTFNGTDQAFSRSFCCDITHPSLGTDTKCVNVTVLPNPTVSVQPEETRVREGTDFSFTCTANRRARFVWSFDTTNGTLPPRASVISTTDTESVLQIRNIRSGVNNGLYFCHAIFQHTDETRTDTGNLVPLVSKCLAIIIASQLNLLSKMCLYSPYYIRKRQ